MTISDYASIKELENEHRDGWGSTTALWVIVAALILFAIVYNWTRNCNEKVQFANELAEMAICKMENISDDGHGKWSIKQVEAVVKTHNPAMHFMHCVTLGDLAYLANMYYADLYPESIQTENGCIKAAILIANDPDGYEGQAFCRWVADIMAKGKSIDWEKYC